MGKWIGEAKGENQGTNLKATSVVQGSAGNDGGGGRQRTDLYVCVCVCVCARMCMIMWMCV